MKTAREYHSNWAKENRELCNQYERVRRGKIRDEERKRKANARLARFGIAPFSCGDERGDIRTAYSAEESELKKIMSERKAQRMLPRAAQQEFEYRKDVFAYRLKMISKIRQVTVSDIVNEAKLLISSMREHVLDYMKRFSSISEETKRNVTRFLIEKEILIERLFINPFTNQNTTAAKA